MVLTKGVIGKEEEVEDGVTATTTTMIDTTTTEIAMTEITKTPTTTPTPTKDGHEAKSSPLTCNDLIRH